MKYRAIGGSWDGYMIGFDGERTEERYHTAKRNIAKNFPCNFRDHLSVNVQTECYILRALHQVEPRMSPDGRHVNRTVGIVEFYLHNFLWHLDDAEIIQLLVDQHRPIANEADAGKGKS